MHALTPRAPHCGPCLRALRAVCAPRPQLYPHVTHYGQLEPTPPSPGTTQPGLLSGGSTTAPASPPRSPSPPPPLSLVLRCERPAAAGQQLFLSYGQLDSTHLALFYGFLLPVPNPYDTVALGEDSSLRRGG